MERLKLRTHLTHLKYCLKGQTYDLQVRQVLESNRNPYEPVPSKVRVIYDGRVFAKIEFDRLKNIVNKEAVFFEKNLAPAGMSFKSLVLFLKTWTF